MVIIVFSSRGNEVVLIINKSSNTKALALFDGFQGWQKKSGNGQERKSPMSEYK